MTGFIQDFDAIEQATKQKYSGQTYSAKSICYPLTLDSKDYYNLLLLFKLDSISRYANGANVLDLCCATGEHLLSLATEFKHGTGLDFSEPYITKARDLCKRAGIFNVDFVLNNARSMQFDDGSFDLVYSFSSLYHIPNVGKVIDEIARVLKPGGVCVLDMGNLYSFNTIVCKAHPELAHPCHIAVGTMNRLLHSANLSILQHRAFQILPLWGDRPRWLRPLLHPMWKRILQRQVRGKMLDEWISNLPVIKTLAFRHVFVCQKIASNPNS